MSHTSAKVVCDTVHLEARSARITTVEYEAPRFLLAEINTHGVIAKSAASSRAIPVKKRIEAVETGGFVPLAFGKNKPGMQASEILLADDDMKVRLAWESARLDAIKWAKVMADHNAHKQHANRILEPFAYVRGVITATEWDNLYKLRISEEAQPEFDELARAIKAAMDASTPREDRWHLPFVTGYDGTDILSPEEKIMVSSARCARVSYRLFDGTVSPLDKDLDLCSDLLNAGHMSPFDHPAMADDLIYAEDGKTARWANPTHHGRFWGWSPVRREIEKQLGIKSRRDSFAPLQAEA